MHAVNRPLHLLLEGLVDFLALRRASCEPGFLAQHFGSLAAVVTLDLRAQMNALRARVARIRRLHGRTLYNPAREQQFVATDYSPNPCDEGTRYARR